ncbi:MAG: SDR family NAD(P)-dependent oxidoreductase [Abyssibacter sp.]|uniref:SDR family NAD(P)-dependent oxidoreductase n=1 Tax=Abyssibacter sp. TaxID=2320200 RepID=UPI00321A342E
MKTFGNKTAAITGAGSGIGAALAMRLAADGCHLALSDVDAKGLEHTAETIRQKAPAGRVTTTRLDVADREAVHAWADETVAKHGSVNLIFNNAGVALGSTIEAASYEDLEWIININLWGVIYGTKAFLPHLKASGDGHIINISSVFGLIGVPSQGAYNATKFAVRGWTEALRQELEIEGASVSATSVHPGGIKTNIARSARFTGMEGVTNMGEDSGKARFEKMFITTPDKAAATILKGVKRNARRVLIGPDAHAIDWISRLAPTGYQTLVARGTRRLFS